ncbi:MAG: FAD-dependent oxidoreductase [Clostridia bacterium]|nr:FAD-dependent oxidoreductase [Clostridia bacterium]
MSNINIVMPEEKKLPTVVHEADVCVVGGGMAGLLAAMAAARHGAKVILMQDRPMLGGNASSEIRVPIRGCKGKENRESGILMELELKNIYRNPTMNWHQWDHVLYEKAAAQENLELLLNCSCLHAEMDGSRIKSAIGWQTTTYAFHEVTAKQFIDCSGDSILAALAGADMRIGREARDEFNEYGANETADRGTMGNTLMLTTREHDHPVPFTPPADAYVYETDEDLFLHEHDFINKHGNFWWIELGGEEETDPLRDAEEIRKELVRVAMGVWDHIKNRGDHGADNWELDFVGLLPGKRETRRCIGDHILTQNDLEHGVHFPDTVAFGGWTMDNHNPKGFYYMGYSSHHIPPKVPFEIPYRSLYSRNIDNLSFAGRNISATHMAMSATRVMATCAVMGQAAGTAAAIAVREGIDPRVVGQQYITELQETLMDDGCWLPGSMRKISEASRTAAYSVSDAEKAVLLDGWERPREGEEHRVMIPVGDTLTMELAEPVKEGELRIMLDPDFSRQSISPRGKMQLFSMQIHCPRKDYKVNMPSSLAREMSVLADGVEIAYFCDNHETLLHISLPEGTKKIEVRFDASWGSECVGVYAFDVK